MAESLKAQTLQWAEDHMHEYVVGGKAAYAVLNSVMKAFRTHVEKSIEKDGMLISYRWINPITGWGQEYGDPQVRPTGHGWVKLQYSVSLGKSFSSWKNTLKEAIENY